ncbi:MAG: polyhydroxyalkanoate synthesis repressor PhaR [Geminicoccaceae bacterium]
MAARKVEAAPEGGGQGSGGAEGEARKGGKVAIVKKYANRRLYNTASSSYVTLEELCQMVREGQDFLVYDAKTGDDITRSVLTQIILEEDAKGRNLMPIGFLRQLIGFYDDSLQSVVPRYLEVSMENFARHQEQMRGYMEETVGRFFPLKPLDVVSPFEEVARQNMALFQKAASLFNPAGEKAGDEPQPATPPAEGGRPKRDDAELSREMRQLKAEMEALQRQMSAMRKAPAGDSD